MKKRKYRSPVIFDAESGGNESVIGQGTGQGTNIDGDDDYWTFERWYEEIAWNGENPDANYNGDDSIDIDDYNYWFENELWKGED